MLHKFLFAGGLLCIPAICLATQPEDGGLCLRGHVVDESGASAAQVSVSVQQAQNASVSSPLSDASGNFEVCGLASVEYRIDARKAGFENQILYATPTAGNEPAVQIALTRDKSATDAANAETAAGAVEGFSAHPDALSNPDVLSIKDVSDPLFTPKHGIHGQAESTWGLQWNAQPNPTLSAPLPVSYQGVSLGASVGRNSFFAGYEKFGLDPQRELQKLAMEELRAGKMPLPTQANALTAEAFVARADRQFSDRDSAYARFRHDELSIRRTQVKPTQLDAQSSSAPSSTQALKISNQQIDVANTVAITPTTINETRAQFVLNDAQLPSGAAAEGVQSGLPTIHRDRVFDAATNVYHQTSGQNLRMGADFVANQMNIAFVESGLGRATAGNSSLSQSDHNTGLYVASQHKLGPNLEATTGIRYDLQSTRGFKADANNLAPQLGLAWAATPKTVIRGGFSVYYDQIPLPALAGSSSPDTAANLQSSARFVSRNGRSAGELADFETLSPTIQNSYAEHASLQIDQQLTAKTTLSAQTEYVRGVQLALPVLSAAKLCASAGACNSGNTFSGQELGSGAVSSYTGMTIALTQQPVRWGSYKASYTLAQASGTGTEQNTSQIADSMRRASFTGSLHSATGPASDFWQAFSHGLVLNETLDYTTKSEFAGLGFINIDARLTKTLAWGKTFRLDALAETVNMFQRTSAAYARSLAEMGPGASSIFANYQRMAAMQLPQGNQMGLRLIF